MTLDRAVVAISEDRRWLVVHEPVDQVMVFCIYEYEDDHIGNRPWCLRGAKRDTGQSADEVLAALLTERDVRVESPEGGSAEITSARPLRAFNVGDCVEVLDTAPMLATRGARGTIHACDWHDGRWVYTVAFRPGREQGGFWMIAEQHLQAVPMEQCSWRGAAARGATHPRPGWAAQSIKACLVHTHVLSRAHDATCRSRCAWGDGHGIGTCRHLSSPSVLSTCGRNSAGASH